MITDGAALDLFNRIQGLKEEVKALKNSNAVLHMMDRVKQDFIKELLATTRCQCDEIEELKKRLGDVETKVYGIMAREADREDREASDDQCVDESQKKRPRERDEPDPDPDEPDPDLDPDERITF